MRAQMDPWTVMGLSRSATQEEIKDQWHRLCKQHHPDLQPEHMRHQAAEYFKEISGAYRTLTARGSSLAAYADFTAAQAAAAAEGHPYAGGFRTAWAPGGTQAKFSNGLVAAVLFVPLVITLCSGMWIALTFADEEDNSWRPHGLMAPPENPWLKEDLKPKVHSHIGAWQQKRRAAAAAAEATAAEAAAAGHQSGGRATAMLPAAAAAAMAAASGGAAGGH